MFRVHRATRWLASAWLLAVGVTALAGEECSGELPANQLRLQVVVQGVKNNQGNITVTVYANDARKFLAKGGKLARQRVPAKAPQTEACFQLPAAPYYAIAVYHDANGDHDLNRNLIGLPTEGGGFSNNPDSLIGLPSLDEVRFATQPTVTQVNIRLKY